MAQDFFALAYFQGANDFASLFLAGVLIFCAAFFILRQIYPCVGV